MIGLVNNFNRPDEIYHVTVMPCYDKKLEAARDDFVFEVESEEETSEVEGLRITEVDSVLTSGEVLELIQVILFMFAFRGYCVAAFCFSKCSSK